MSNLKFNNFQIVLKLSTCFLMYMYHFFFTYASTLCPGLNYFTTHLCQNYVMGGLALNVLAS